MPYDGNGDYSPPGSPAFPAVSGETIVASYYNSVINDIAAALDNCVTRSGQTGVTITDIVAAPTASPGTNTTQLATCAFVLANAGGVDVQEFTSGGTWTKPAAGDLCLAICIGGGGGGASGRRGAAATVRAGGSGGGGGGYTMKWIQASDLGATETVTIGAGGTGGAAQTTNDTDGNDGNNGGNTSFGSALIGYGGSGGVAGTATHVNGGQGGGVLTAGNQSGAAAPTGGAPRSPPGSYGTDSQTSGHFGGSSSNYTGTTVGKHGPPGAWGGGNGGGVRVNATAVGNGGCSFEGGAGGACGGFINAADALVSGAEGGSTVGENGGGGTAGTSHATTPTAGGAGSTRQGGGGGGASTGAAAAAGGVGGPRGGAGGGGGGGTNGNNSGAGGDGGDGYCIVFTW